MVRLLHVVSGPRGEASFSRRAAEEFLKAFRQRHPDAEVETLDLFATDLPDFDAPAAEAKYAVMRGEEPKDDAARAWKRVIEMVDRLKAADVVVISCPMWNFSIPYRLKQYIDVIVQPVLTFSFSAEEGYTGLVTHRPAVLFLARGGDYSPAAGGGGLDMQAPYLQAVLRFIGFADVHTITIEPTMHGGPALAEQRLRGAVAEARELASRL